ncbi:hypothetical protein DFH06DRAFT_1148016 [Mycena polygramma]|nr:hypothetical protein DFH06DRAFT_1148016 [Mycena polygramma]
MPSADHSANGAMPQLDKSTFSHTKTHSGCQVRIFSFVSAASHTSSHPQTYAPMKTYHSLLLLHLFLARAQAPTDAHADAHADPARWVNPFIGTSNGGHAFAGATLPWGSVNVGKKPNALQGLESA